MGRSWLDEFRVWKGGEVSARKAVVANPGHLAQRNGQEWVESVASRPSTSLRAGC